MDLLLLVVVLLLLPLLMVVLVLVLALVLVLVLALVLLLGLLLAALILSTSRATKCDRCRCLTGQLTAVSSWVAGSACSATATAALQFVCWMSAWTCIHSVWMAWMPLWLLTVSALCPS